MPAPSCTPAQAIYMDGSNAMLPDGTMLSLRQLGEPRRHRAPRAARPML